MESVVVATINSLDLPSFVSLLLVELEWLDLRIRILRVVVVWQTTTRNGDVNVGYHNYLMFGSLVYPTVQLESFIRSSMAFRVGTHTLTCTHL